MESEAPGHDTREPGCKTSTGCFINLKNSLIAALHTNRAAT